MPRHLLLPPSSPSPPPPLPRFHHSKPSGKLIRSRAHSVSYDPPPLHQPRWFNTDCKFDVIQNNLQIDGYQIYAVEKWIVQRTRAVTLLTVYTGDPKDKVTVSALAPPSSLSEQEADAEWEKAIHDLRRDGARPRQTDDGVTIVTSLANFRSDFTVVYIPGGNFLTHRDRLYANINLLRMGCSGRSALTLQEPSDATKDRFLTTYHFRESMRAEPLFATTVLEFVKLIQTGLAFFDMFPSAPEELNGLLCDITVDGIQRWVAEIGEPYLKVEPTERVADPSVVSALLSLLITVRNKLSTLGLSQTVPKDPFVEPQLFAQAVAGFAHQHQRGHHGTPPPPAAHAGLPLTLKLLWRIDAAHDRVRATDSYKVHRVLLSKLDDLTSATTSAISSSAASAAEGATPGSPLSLAQETGGGGGGGGSGTDATPDLAAFVRRTALPGGKDGVASLRYLWTGRTEQLGRRRAGSVLSDPEREDDRDRDRTDGKTTEEETEAFVTLPWSNKVQKRIEGWAGREFGRSKAKRPSIDITAKVKAVKSGLEESTPASSGPSVVISKDPEEVMSVSSGQVSPISPSASMLALGVLPSAQTSSVNVDSAEYDRRIAQFNQARPPLLGAWRAGAGPASWADPPTEQEVHDSASASAGLSTAKATTVASATPRAMGLGPRSKSGRGLGDGGVKGRVVGRRTRGPSACLKRCRSFDDASLVDDNARISVAMMQIDVDLCVQYLIIRRRQIRAEGLVATLQAIFGTVSTSNDALRKDLAAHEPLMQEVSAKMQTAVDIEAARRRADAITRDAHALAYEALRFDVPRLWQMAQAPRQRVFAIRERVSGVGPGVAGARAHGHGRFNRVQHTLDRRERLVDWMGRTDRDVEEERDLPEIMPDDQEEEVPAPAPRPAGGWLLAFFTRWGKVLGVGATAKESAPKAKEKGADSNVKAEVLTTAEPMSDGNAGKVDEGGISNGYQDASSSPIKQEAGDGIERLSAKPLST